MSITLTVVIPAHNEQAGLGDTIRSLYAQTVRADRIIVVDDGSTDETAALGRFWGVEVLSTPQATGSKAGAQNYALAFVDTDLVLPVDADTTLDPEYIERIKRPFADPQVSIASGCVLTKRQRTRWERARQLEYLVGFHYYRQIQNRAGAITVCSGCCTAFRTRMLVEAGGHPDRTMVEDIDFTWSQQIMGRAAVYVPDAVARAAEPDSLHFMAKQLKRWKSGYFQNVRLHWRSLLRSKKMLALWVSLQLWEMVSAPLLLGLTGLWLWHGLDWWKVPLLWLAGDALTLLAGGLVRLPQAGLLDGEGAALLPRLVGAEGLELLLRRHQGDGRAGPRAAGFEAWSDGLRERSLGNGRWQRNR